MTASSPSARVSSSEYGSTLLCLPRRDELGGLGGGEGEPAGVLNSGSPGFVGVGVTEPSRREGGRLFISFIDGPWLPPLPKTSGA